MTVTHTKEETLQLMDEVGSKLIAVCGLMNHYTIAGVDARALFAALDAYDIGLQDGMPKNDERTHDSTSAINDAETPLPRGEGADAPQSTLANGDMALMYTEQNFNSLVAANTAMETELSSLMRRLADKDETMASLRNTIDFMAKASEKHEETVFELKRNHDKIVKGLEEERGEHAYTKQLLAGEQRRTERAKGYLDRVLDEQGAYAAPQTETVTIPPAPVGPRLGDIYDPPRPTRHDSDSPTFARGYVGEARHSHERRRAY